MNYQEWKRELLAIATAEIPNFTAYNAQYHLDNAFYLDPALWEGGNYDYQNMTPAEYFNDVRAEIEKHILDFPMKTPEQIAEAKREAEESHRQFLADNPDLAEAAKKYAGASA